MEISNYLQQILSDDGLAVKVSMITCAIQSRQEKGMPIEGPLLPEEQILLFFTRVPPEMYLL
jgi:hypothetical protein